MLQHQEETSDYGTDPDNSGTCSVGYTKVSSILASPNPSSQTGGNNQSEMVINPRSMCCIKEL